MRPLARPIAKLFGYAGDRRSAIHTHDVSEPPMKLAEIAALATVPELAGLPLEFWPGYRHLPHPATDDTDMQPSASRSSTRPVKRPHKILGNVLGNVFGDQRRATIARKMRT